MRMARRQPIRIGDFGPVGIAIRLTGEATRRLYEFLSEIIAKRVSPKSAQRRGTSIVIVEGLTGGVDISFKFDGTPEVHITAYGRDIKFSEDPQKGTKTSWDRPIELYISTVEEVDKLIGLLFEARERLLALRARRATKGRKRARRGWDPCQTRLI